ncbi:MAG: class I SAM-dependent methyltransferase [Prochlorococcus marinus CUG1437]|nr:class I SAM-dependent methyltransferase [Prochlorococcus marinus CUG1437]
MNKCCCRISKQDDLIEVFDLGSHYMCGEFPSSISENIEKGRLALGWSPSSGLLQLSEDRDITSMYGQNYGYRSGLNSSMVDHLRKKVEYLLELSNINNKKCVLDIGSNDGTLLSNYSNDLIRIGIDPTIVKYGKYYQENIIKLADFFSYDNFNKVSQGYKADIITSISMFYDLPDPNLFVANIREVMSPQGIWNLEQSYMPSMLRTNSYDTVCHEHLEYYSLYVIKKLLEKNHLRILDVVFNRINGGSFSVTVCHQDSKYESNMPIINWMLSQEERMNLNTPYPYREFERKAYTHRSDLQGLIKAINSSDKKIAGYGASTKGNVILQFCQLTSEEIYGIAEVNEDKFNKFTPGSNIPILSETEIKSTHPDYMLVLPWHFRENIIEREKEYLRKGGKLIFPLPEIEIVG